MDTPEENLKPDNNKTTKETLVKCPNCSHSFYIDESEVGKLKVCPICNKEGVFNVSQNNEDKPPKS